MLPFQYGTRKNNDCNSQETWVSLASKGYLIKMYKITTQPVIWRNNVCLFDAQWHAEFGGLAGGDIS
jgi:hypothetical protein